MVLHVGRPAAHFIPQPVRLIRLDRRTADLVHQQPRERQGLVPNHFRREPHVRPACEQPVVGILRQQLRRHARGLPVRRTHHDGLLQRFHVPAGPDEFGREPIEQLRMRRRFALRAEILGGLHDADAEVHAARTGSPSRAPSADWTDRPATGPGPADSADSAVGDAASTAGSTGVTTSPGLSYSPRISRCVSRGFAISSMTMTVGRAFVERIPSFPGRRSSVSRRSGYWPAAAFSRK